MTLIFPTIITLLMASSSQGHDHDSEKLISMKGIDYTMKLGIPKLDHPFVRVGAGNEECKQWKIFPGFVLITK